MKFTSNENFVYAMRGGAVESVHEVSAVVLAEDGRISHTVGNPHLVTFTRSSIKPFQAQPLLTSGAADRFGFTEKEMAITCGSHNGTDDHQSTAKSILLKGGNTAESLQCGGHWPDYLQMKNIYPRNGEDNDPTRNNCSGKHAGFLALARHLGDDPAEYLSRESKTQRAVAQALSDILECDISQAPWGIDGCSAPNYAVSLDRLALGYLKLATANDGPLFRTASAMRAFPEMVSGDGRFDLALAHTFPNNAIAKVGAEAVQAICFRKQKISIVVKVHDGARRALAPACIALLQQLGLLPELVGSPLEQFARPQLKNHRRIATGEICAAIELRAAAPVHATV